MKKHFPIITLFGSYDDRVLSTKVLLSGLYKIVPSDRMRTVHFNVPSAVLYDHEHTTLTQLLKRAWNRIKVHVKLVSQWPKVLGSDVIVILPFGVFDLLHAWIFKTFFGIHVIYVPQNSLYDLLWYATGKDKNQSLLIWMIYQIERLLWQIPEVVVFNTKVEAQEHKKLLNLPHLKTRVVPLGADDTIFRPTVIKQKSHGGTRVLFYG